MKRQIIAHHMNHDLPEGFHLVDWNSVIIDILPPYDDIKLVFLSTIVVKCPQCGKTYYRKEISMNSPQDVVACKNCNFRGQFIKWKIKCALKD